MGGLVLVMGCRLHCEGKSLTSSFPLLSVSTNRSLSPGNDTLMVTGPAGMKDTTWGTLETAGVGSNVATNIPKKTTASVPVKRARSPVTPLPMYSASALGILPPMKPCLMWFRFSVSWGIVGRTLAPFILCCSTAKRFNWMGVMPAC